MPAKPCFRVNLTGIFLAVLPSVLLFDCNALAGLQLSPLTRMPSLRGFYFWALLLAAAQAGLLQSLAAPGTQVFDTTGSTLPIAINTWAFTNATAAAWEALVAADATSRALDAVERASQ